MASRRKSAGKEFYAEWLKSYEQAHGQRLRCSPCQNLVKRACVGAQYDKVCSWRGGQAKNCALLARARAEMRVPKGRCKSPQKSKSTSRKPTSLLRETKRPASRISNATDSKKAKTVAANSRTLDTLPKRLRPLINVVLTNEATFKQLPFKEQQAIKEGRFEGVYSKHRLRQVFPPHFVRGRRHFDEIYDDILSHLTRSQIATLGLFEPPHGLWSSKSSLPKVERAEMSRVSLEDVSQLAQQIHLESGPQLEAKRIEPARVVDF